MIRRSDVIRVVHFSFWCALRIFFNDIKFIIHYERIYVCVFFSRVQEKKKKLLRTHIFEFSVFALTMMVATIRLLMLINYAN